MVKIELKPGESFDQALKRFNKEVMEEGIINEVKDRKFFTKPSQEKRLREKERKLKIKIYKKYNR